MACPSVLSTINERLTDDELRLVLARLEGEKEKEVFGLVCKRWLKLQSNERKKLAARAGPHMLKKMASRFSQLLELDLSQSASRSFFPGISDSDLDVIAGGFKELRSLNLQNCAGITNHGIRSIAHGISSLQSLDVSFCKKLTDEGISHIAERCRDIHRLHLTGCRSVGDSTLRFLSQSCPNLSDLNLQGCVKVTDEGLTNLVSGCRQIKFLDISKCSNVGDAGVSAVAKACHSLKTLKLLDCYKVGDESLSSLTTFCRSIETLIIGGCRNISDGAIKRLAAERGGSIRNLRMDWCLNVSDESLRCILIECRNLERLDIGCCEEVSDGAFACLRTMNGDLRLRFLKVSNCPKITVNGIAAVLEKCLKLEYLDVRSCPHVTKLGCEDAGLQFPASCKVNFSGSLLDPGVICLD